MVDRGGGRGIGRLQLPLVSHLSRSAERLAHRHNHLLVGLMVKCNAPDSDHVHPLPSRLVELYCDLKQHPPAFVNLHPP